MYGEQLRLHAEAILQERVDLANRHRKDGGLLRCGFA